MINQKFLYKVPFLSIISFLLCISCYSQPYNGTIFVNKDIITSSNESTLQSAFYAGQGNRVVFDRRINDWVTINAFLFDITWKDGLTSTAVVNPEFGTIDSARPEAEKYGREIGRLPYCLRVDVNEIWIHKGTEPFGGGNKSILIHTGQSASYEENGILEETLIHEATHTSLDSAHANSTGWQEAQTLDNAFISDYAKEFPDREDLAETFLLWFAVRYRSSFLSSTDLDSITRTIPNRLQFLDSLKLNMSPFQLPGSGPILSTEPVTNEISIYPNPTSEKVFIGMLNGRTANYNLFSLDGKKVHSGRVNENDGIVLSDLKNGFYMLELQINNKVFRRKIFKQQ